MPPNPLSLFSPRLITRAFDDLHAIAEVARALSIRNGDGLTTTMREALDDLSAVADAADRLREVEWNLMERVNEVETQLVRMLETLGGIDTRLISVGALQNSVDRLETTAGQLGGQAHSLEGAADRLTRMIDRIPGV